MLRHFDDRYLVQLIGLALVLTMNSSAEAQRRGRGGMRPGEISQARLLLVEAVKTELKLSPDQKKKAEAINETLTQERHELFSKVSKESHERGKKMAELDAKTDAKVKQLLSEPQQKRLRELLIQVNGASELMKKDVQDAIGISKEQRQKLSDINRANEKARREALTNFDGDRTAKIIELQQAAEKKLLEILTDKQREQFEKLKGKRITIELFKA